MVDKVEEIFAANLVLPLVKDLILPKVESIIKKYSIKNVSVPDVQQHFETYLSQRYEKYSIIDTLVFPNKQTLFKALYEPLTITTATQRKKTVEIKIDSYPDSFLPTFVRAIIEDTAGMGKSTISKKLFLSIIEQAEGIPVFIELRKLNARNSILKEIQNQFSPIGKQITIDFINKLLDEGEMIFLFDGFDEISKADKEFVINDLHRFIEKGNNNNFLITSRSEDSLVSFGDFQKFKVKPLTEKTAFKLISRHDQYSFKPIAKLLIEQLKENKEESLKQFLTNPFLVSLLYKSFEYKKDIPLKKTQFYRQVFDALFEAHDLSKEGFLKREKYSNLHIDDFERVLRYVGFLTSKENKIQYEKDYIISVIDNVKLYLPDLLFKSSDFLKDLLETVPIFKQDGSEIKWAHKSLQDYFAAKFIWIDSKSDQLTILKNIYNDLGNQRFSNVIDLFYELDPITFDNTILLWLLEEFEEYSSKSYLKFDSIPIGVLENRRALTFSRSLSIVIVLEEEYETNTNEDHDVYEYIQKVSTKYKVMWNRLTIFRIKNTPNIAIVYSFQQTNISVILEFINKKYPTICCRRTNTAGRLEELKFLKVNHSYPINESPINILNNPDFFELVNLVLEKDFILDYKASFQRLNQLRELNNKWKLNDLTKW